MYVHLPDISEVSAGGLEVLDETLGLGGVHGALLLGNGVQRSVDISGHTLGVTADVEVGALGDHVPDVGGLVHHLVLDVLLGGTLSGEGNGELGESTGLDESLELLFVDEVHSSVSAAKEEDGGAELDTGLDEGESLLQEASEGGEAGTGANHDDGDLGVGGELEVGLSDKDGSRGTVLGLLVGNGVLHPGGADTLVDSAGGHLLVDQSTGNVDSSLGDLGGRGDGVESGLESGSNTGEENTERGLGGGELGHDLEQRSLGLDNPLGVLVLASGRGEVLESLSLGGVGGVGGQSNESRLLGRREEAGVSGQSGSQVAGREGRGQRRRDGSTVLFLGVQREVSVGGHVEESQSLVDSLGQVVTEDTNVVTSLVGQTGTSNVKLEVDTRSVGLGGVELSLDGDVGLVGVLGVKDGVAVTVGHVDVVELGILGVVDGDSVLEDGGGVGGGNGGVTFLSQNGVELGPQSLSPGSEVVLDALVIITEADLDESLGTLLDEDVVDNLGNLVEVLVLSVAQTENTVLEVLEPLASVVTLGEPLVESGSVVGGLTVTVGGEEEEGNVLFLELLLVLVVIGSVIIEVDNLESGLFVSSLGFLTESLGEALSSTGLGAKEDGDLLSAVVDLLFSGLDDQGLEGLDSLGVTGARSSPDEHDNAANENSNGGGDDHGKLSVLDEHGGQLGSNGLVGGGVGGVGDNDGLTLDDGSHEINHGGGRRRRGGHFE